MLLSEAVTNRENNFDFLRFVAATLVVLSHSWPLTTGSNSSEPLALLTQNQLDFGALAVDIFFIISGFLISYSYDRSRNIASFARARALRIAPALLVVVAILALIVGPLVTTLSQVKYWSYFPFYSFISDHLPGVFAGNPFPLAADGSLWTIKFEVLFYVLVGILGLTSLLANRVVLACLLLVAITPLGRHYTLDLLSFFAVGMLFYGFRKHIHIRANIAVLSVLLVVAGLAWRIPFISTWVLPLILPLGIGYAILWFTYSPAIRLHNFAKYGDWSYGLYIYAFPVQQLLVQYARIRSPLLLFLLAFPISTVLAALSWHLIEKHALKLKRPHRSVLDQSPFITTTADAKA